MNTAILHLDRAARALQPLIIHGDPDTRHAVHAAMNALCAARLAMETGA